MDAFSAQDNTTALDLISQASSLSKTGAKLLQSIKDNQVSSHWQSFYYIYIYMFNPINFMQLLKSAISL